MFAPCRALAPGTHSACACPCPPPPDNFQPNGKEGVKDRKLKSFLSFQPRWDNFGRMLQNLSASVPVMTSTGNHELEFQPDGTVFAAYNARCVRGAGAGSARARAR